MTTVIGRGVTIEVGDDSGPSKTITAITKANPGVATSVAHGLADAKIGYLSGVNGMVQLEGQIVRVNNPLTDTFELEGLNTSAYPTFTGSCTFKTVGTWQTVTEASGYSIGGGEFDKLDATRLIDVIKQEEAGYLAAQSVTINLVSQTAPSLALQQIKAAAVSGGYLSWRITFPDGAVRIWRGQPALPNEDVQRGQVGSGSISVTVKGVVIEAAA
jgi:hypothetical protein